MIRHSDNDNRRVAANSNPAGLRFLSVCSGIEAASVAWPQWEAVGYAEIEPFPAFVLNHHYGAGRPKFMPDPGENQLKKKDKAARLAAIRTVSKLPEHATVTNWGDFTKIDTTTLGRVDILCGGTPCQAFSVAGLRGGLDDARGNLTLKFVELAHELAGLGRTAGNGLRNVVWENVVGVLSDKGNAFGCFLGGLVGADAAIEPPTRGKWGSAGLVAGPKGRAAWRICDAQYWGVAQRRRRVIVVADFGNGADPAEVLFEREGVQRHTPPSREKGEGIAGAAKGGAGGSGEQLTPSAEVAPCLRARSNASHRLDTEAVVGYAPEIARCVATREGSSQDYETTTMVAVQTLDGSDVARTLSARHDGSPCVDRGPDAVVCFTAKDYGGDAAYGVSPTLRAGGHSGSHANAGVMPAIAFNGQMSTPQVDVEMTQTLQAKNPQAVAYTSAVRRLTPVECERLQGFPDNYTAIPWRGKPADQCPDGPRYKSLGNSWAVPLFAWLGKRIDMHMPSVATLRTADNDNKQEARIARAA